MSHSAPPPPPELASAHSGSKGKRFWTKTKVIFGSVVGVVGAVTGVIGVIPFFTQDPTNFKHLVTSAEVLTSEVTEWALPPEALGLDFPVSSAPCDATQIAWLEKHAVPLTRSFEIKVRNTAKEGPMLALVDLRSTAQGDADRGEVNVRLVCDPSGKLPQQLFYGKLLADDPTTGATNTRITSEGLSSATPEVAVSFNLAPGESGKIPLELFSRNPVKGSIEMTVLSGEEEKVVQIPGSDFEMPALLFGGDMFLFITPEGAQCQRIAKGVISVCTMDEIRHEQAIAPK